VTLEREKRKKMREWVGGWRKKEKKREIRRRVGSVFGETLPTGCLLL
jgi:hypothetical protein